MVQPTVESKADRIEQASKSAALALLRIAYSRRSSIQARRERLSVQPGQQGRMHDRSQ